MEVMLLNTIVPHCSLPAASCTWWTSAFMGWQWVWAQRRSWASFMRLNSKYEACTPAYVHTCICAHLQMCTPAYVPLGVQSSPLLNIVSCCHTCLVHQGRLFPVSGCPETFTSGMCILCWQIGPNFYSCRISVLESQNMEFLFGLDMLRRHQVCP